MADSLIDKLRATRAGYAAECAWHRFLVDAYTGGGGFATSTPRQPESGFWGPIAEVYSALGASALSSISRNTYLDRYPREDAAKFAARLNVAHYPNYVGPLTDLKNSYLLRKPFQYASEPKALSDWRADMNGKGTKWDDLRPGIVLLASLVGWCPVLIDRPSLPVPAEQLTRAQVQAMGLDRTTVLPLAPANLLDWGWKDGAFEWAKVRLCRSEKTAWDSPAVTVEEITVWTPTEATRWEIRKAEDGDEAVSAPVVTRHPFGRVPIAIFRHKRSPGEVRQVHGLPMHEAISGESRRLFNLVSEMDEHIRSQVFAILVHVGSVSTSPQDGEKMIGAANGLELSIDATKQHYYLAPPPSVADTLEKRMENSIREIHRMARTEYSRPVGGPTSGTARAYEFEGTNRAVADYGAEIARGETEVEQIVGAGLEVPADQLAALAVSAPEDFGVQDLEQEIKVVVEAVSLKVGATAEVEMKKRVIARVLPQLPPETVKKIDGELVEISKEPPPAPPTPPAQVPSTPADPVPPVPNKAPPKAA